jgi:hypothetical protein
MLGGSKQSDEDKDKKVEDAKNRLKHHFNHSLPEFCANFEKLNLVLSDLIFLKTDTFRSFSISLISEKCQEFCNLENKISYMVILTFIWQILKNGPSDKK